MFVEGGPPDWFLNGLTVSMGLVVGSFMNVVVARIPHGKSVVRPGSHCPKCRKPVRWYDNIPVLSYVALRGKCRHCGQGISIRYPVIEALTGLLFLAAKMRFGFDAALVLRHWPFVALLVAITFIDLEHRIIPDVLNLIGGVLGLATSLLAPELGWIGSLLGISLGFTLFYGFAWLYEWKTGRSGLGGGDIKLLAMLGAFVGPQGVLVCVLMSSILGSVIGLGWALATRQKTLMTAAIPFGPFLVLGALYYHLLAEVLWSPLP